MEIEVLTPNGGTHAQFYFAKQHPPSTVDAAVSQGSASQQNTQSRIAIRSGEIPSLHANGDTCDAVDFKSTSRGQRSVSKRAGWVDDVALALGYTLLTAVSSGGPGSGREESGDQPRLYVNGNERHFMTQGQDERTPA